MKHLTSLKDTSKDDLLKIIEIAKKLKAKRKSGEYLDILKGKTLIMLFQKTSTRTRLSFEAAMTELGGHAIFLDSKTSQFALTDFRDEIKAVMRFGDVLMFRAIKSSDVELAASINHIPVIDACSEKYHPCQALGDMLTMIESAGGLEKVGKVVWFGVENNVSNTLKLACAKLGVEIVISAPEANIQSVDSELNEIADKTGCVKYIPDPVIAIKDANFIHTDTWMDMEFFENGKVKEKFEDEYTRRKNTFMPYQVNASIIDSHAKNARIMHCMPCHIGFEITRDAIDHNNSIIFDQAENRLHIEKAIILWLLGINI